MSKTRRKLSIGIAVILLVVVVASIIQRSSGRSALDRYKAELRAKGEKLTFKELGVTPSTDAEHVAALNVLANYSSFSGGILPRTMDYVAPGKARNGWSGELRSDAGVVVAVTAEWEKLDRDNELAAPSLQQIRPALRAAPPDTGRAYEDTFASVTNGSPRTFIRDRTIAQALQRDVIGELHRGNLDAALDDLHALTGQVRMNRNEPILVSQMIRVAIAGLALNATWEALQAPGWDEQRLAALQRDWEDAPLLGGLAKAFEGERAVGQVLMAEVRRSGVEQVYKIWIGGSSANTPNKFSDRFSKYWWDRLSSAAYRLAGSADADELAHLQYSTRSLELIRELDSGRPWSEVEGAMKSLMAEIERKIAEDRFHRLRMSLTMLPNFTQSIQAAAHAETQRRLTITAIAIKRYQLKNGKPPANLAALVPGFMAAVPIDPMSGKALCYRLNNDSTFTLYSVGEDGKDDGGRPGTGLWAGLDAVWPSVATPEEESAAKRSMTSK